MNKITIYIGLAILLGTVTMVAPLMLLDQSSPSEPLPSNFVVTTAGEEENQGRYTIESDMFSENVSSDTWTKPESAAAPEATPEETEIILKTAENPLDLSSIGLMTVPSFLVALGVFIYLKKREA